jgi:hypothetical protein
MLFGSNGVTISKSGNTFYAGNTTYTRSGGMLISSNGKTWSGIKSDSDCEAIIMHDQR